MRRVPGAGNRSLPAVVGLRASLRSEVWGASATLRRRPREKPPESVRGGKRGGAQRASAERMRKLDNLPDSR